MDHLGLGIEQAVVHVDVNHLCAILYLLAGDAECFVVFLLVNQSQELARTGHVASFAHIHKVVFGLHLEQFQAREPERLWARGRLVGLGSGGQLGKAGNVGRGGAAATSQDVDQPLVEVLLHLSCHDVGRLVVLPQGIGQAGVGVGADVVGGLAGEHLQKGLELAGAEGAVQPYGEEVGVLYRGQESLQSLP